jgi:diguanylate cyclase (GGDEF)-like protein/PAS domain S-box-containing protein
MVPTGSSYGFSFGDSCRSPYMTIYLPRQSPKIESAAPQDVDVPRTSVRLLIIDDDRVDRQIYLRFLRADGKNTYVVTETESVEEGYRLIRDEIYDCILLDYRLPESDGLAMYRTLTSTQWGPSVAPVIMMTGQGNESVAVAAMKCGIADYLTKEGLTAHALQRAITNAVDVKARRRAEDKLAEERERFRITLQSIDDAVITADVQTRVTYVNAAAESLLGLERNAVEGRRVDEVIHLLDPQTSKRAANLIGQSVLHGEVFRREQACLLIRTDGTVCHVTEIVAPVLDVRGVVNGVVIVFRDVTRDVDRTRDLQRRAMHDPLTGLSNRADFDQRLRAVFGKARHLEQPTALLAIDLDRFKEVNDTAGHAAGDAALCQVATACRFAVRSSDTVARLGGDEFAIILDNCAEERAAYIGQHLLQALNPLVFEWKGAQCSIGAGIGVAMRRIDMADEQSWLQAADEACYDAKRQGRGRLRIAVPV